MSIDPLKGKQVFLGIKDHKIGLLIDGTFVEPIGKGTANYLK